MDIKLAVFDFDSTLMDGETIDFLAKDYVVNEESKKEKAVRPPATAIYLI